MNKKSITRISREQLETMRAQNELPPLRAPTAPPPSLGPDAWANAELVLPKTKPKQQLTLRIDQDVVDWFRAQGEGYQSRMNAVLRAYVNARQR